MADPRDKFVSEIGDMEIGGLIPEEKEELEEEIASKRPPLNED